VTIAKNGFATEMFTVIAHFLFNVRELRIELVILCILCQIKRRTGVADTFCHGYESLMRLLELEKVKTTAMISM
ncbi:MAG: hypothetical protein FWC50_02925, partial [Planctomycetaceae bacterium]|nr:hypothetical protein [Planctomycetaceae bacterium]